MQKVVPIGFTLLDVETLTSQAYKNLNRDITANADQVKPSFLKTVSLLGNISDRTKHLSAQQLLASLDPSLRHINMILLGTDVSAMALYETQLAVSCSGPFCIISGNVLQWQTAVVQLCSSEIELGNTIHHFFKEIGGSALWQQYREVVSTNNLYRLEY